MRGAIYSTALADFMPMNPGFKSKTICKRKNTKKLSEQNFQTSKRKRTEEFSD